MTASQRETELEADAANNGQLKTPIEARQAVKTRHIRWVLVISLTLGVVALGGAYAWYESMQSHTPALASDQRPVNG
jgi:predicted porin